jgi:hypothetical protein
MHYNLHKLLETTADGAEEKQGRNNSLLDNYAHGYVWKQ